MTVRFFDEPEGMLEWTDVDGVVPRTSHALATEDGVWLVDPVDDPGLDERLLALGETRGVVQLIGRHRRDGTAVAERHGVPLHVVPRVAVPGAPFVFMPVLSVPGWRESALWWEARRTLVVADALGTLRYFRAGDERIGVHPLLRPRPPRALGRYDARHVLCGHGRGLHGDDAGDLVREALRTARRRLPAAWLSAFRAARGRK